MDRTGLVCIAAIRNAARRPGLVGIVATLATIPMLLALALLFGAHPASAQTPATNANLSSLTVLGSAIPDFSSDTTSYTVDLDAPEAPATPADSDADVAYDPDDADSDTAGHQVVLNEGDHTVTITVTAEDDSTRKTYRVTIRVADVTDSVTTTARAIVDPPGSGTIQYAGSIRRAGDVDWFAIDLAADNMYRFTLKGSYRNHTRTLGDPMIVGLYDNDGNYMDGTLSWADIYRRGAGASNAQLHYMATTDGAYYLAVRGLADQTGTYALRVLIVPDDLLPDNPSTPGRIAAGGSDNGWLDYKGDQDWYRMSDPVPGAEYAVEARPNGTGPRLSWPWVRGYDHQGEPVEMDYLYRNRAKALFTPNSDQDHFVAVSSQFRHLVGRYTITVFDSLPLTGDVVVGSTLSVDPSGIADPDGVSRASLGAGTQRWYYRWFRVAEDGGETKIAGANAAAYTLTVDDEGYAIRARVLFTDDDGNREIRGSALSESIQPSSVVSWRTTEHAIYEKAAGVTLILELTEDQGGDITVPITLTRHGDTAATDYTGVPESVTFDDNSATDDDDRRYETFTVSAATDDDFDDASITVALGTLPSGVVPGANTNVQVTIRDLTKPVTHDWDLTPDDIMIGEEFRLLFVTWNQRNARSSNIADYDAFVRNAIQDNGHAQIRERSDRFVVLGSTDNRQARDHTATTYTSDDQGVPIYWLNGPKAADTYADFYDGNWDHADPGRRQTGDAHDFEANELVMTGTKSDGTRATDSNGSLALGSTRRVSMAGSPGRGTRYALQDTRVGQTVERRFYSLSYVFKVVEPDAPYVVRNGLAVTSTPTAGTDTYGVGEDIEFTVTFSEAVQVTGDPEIGFSLGGDSRRASYVSGSGATALVFAYTVQSGDTDDNGIWVSNHNHPDHPTFRLDDNDAITADGDDVILRNRALGTLSEHKVDGSLTGADARLSGLTLSGITLDQTFDAGTVSYTATVANSVSSTTVAATVQQSGASAAITPADADTNTTGHQVDLSVGENTITVTVTGSGGVDTRTYTITITRASG